MRGEGGDAIGKAWHLFTVTFDGALYWSWRTAAFLGLQAIWPLIIVGTCEQGPEDVLGELQMYRVQL